MVCAMFYLHSKWAEEWWNFRQPARDINFKDKYSHYINP
jgi:hypothetical protein